MAGLNCSIRSGALATSTTPKTLLQIKAPTNQAVKLSKIAMFGSSAAGGTDSPVTLRLTRSTANFGAGTTGTATKLDSARGETIQTALLTNLTTEPTTPTEMNYVYRFNPQLGILEPIVPGREIVIAGGTAINFEVTAGAGTPTVELVVAFEE